MFADMREFDGGETRRDRKTRGGRKIGSLSFLYSFPLLLFGEWYGRSPDGRRYPGDWEIKIEPVERKLQKSVVSLSLSLNVCVLGNFIAQRRAREKTAATRMRRRKRRMSTSNAGEIFDLNVGGDPAALARSNFSLVSENSSCKIPVSHIHVARTTLRSLGDERRGIRD